MGLMTFFLLDANIEVPFSDQVLLCFVRARKSDLNRTLRLVCYYQYPLILANNCINRSTFSFTFKLKNYMKMTRNYPDLFTNLQPARLQNVLEFRHVLASPVRDNNGSRIFFLKTGKNP